MSKSATIPSLEQPFWPVKSTESISIGSTDPSMIHHKVRVSKRDKMIVSYSRSECKSYGVSKTYRLLSPQLLLKKFEYVRDCLKYVIGLTKAEREATLRLLRFWSYYGHVYPKEAQVTSEPGCSKATYWRTIRLLNELHLVVVINRYVIRPHAQISNLYKLDNLVKLIAKYLAEHIAHVWPDWFDPIIHKTWPDFWSLFPSPEHRTQFRSLNT